MQLNRSGYLNSKNLSSRDLDILKEKYPANKDQNEILDIIMGKDHTFNFGVRSYNCYDALINSEQKWMIKTIFGKGDPVNVKILKEWSWLYYHHYNPNGFFIECTECGDIGYNFKGLQVSERKKYKRERCCS